MLKKKLKNSISPSPAILHFWKNKIIAVSVNQEKRSVCDL